LSNVICVMSDGEVQSIPDIIKRLGYFEFMEYRRVNPILFEQSPSHQWTDRQRWELQGPRGRANGAMGSLWQRRPDLLPVPASSCPNPFAEQSAFDPIRHPPAEPPSPDPPAEEPEPELLVSEQDAVITARVDEDMVVVAPPGTGKTHTLVERIAYLVAEGHVENPKEQVLALSFTRSAVAELRKRLAAKTRAGGPDGLAYVDIRTFDSFATRLLRLDISTDVIVGGYANRIDQFNSLFEEGQLPNSVEHLSKIRFLLVDEVQDLNGARARMVLLIAGVISRGRGCSMFLGDPAQAIYDYEQESITNPFTSIAFLEELFRGSYCGRPPARKEYTNYRRFETKAMLGFVHRARSAMGADGLSPDGSLLDELFAELGQRESLPSLVDSLKPNRTAAILTRNNLEAYWIWQWLRDRNVHAELWRGARGSYWPGWVARLVLGFKGESMSLDKANQRWEAHIGRYFETTFPQAIEFLRVQGVMERDAEFIPVSEIAGHLLNSGPVATEDQRTSSLIISTIHRSKGLEFDDVYLLAPERMNSDEDVRVTYVAATRAKRSLRILSRDDKIVRRGSKKDNRLNTDGFHMYGYPQQPYIGLLVDGYEVVDPRSLLSLDDPLAAQKHLWDECVGRVRSTQVDTNRLLVGSEAIGFLNPSLTRDLASIRGLRQSSTHVQGELRVVDLASVAVSYDNGQESDAFGAASIALVPVVTGVVSI